MDARLAETAPSLPATGRSQIVDLVVVSANHASFGDYGIQPGDEKATISSAKVRSIVTEQLTLFLHNR